MTASLLRLVLFKMAWASRYFLQGPLSIFLCSRGMVILSRFMYLTLPKPLVGLWTLQPSV